MHYPKHDVFYSKNKYEKSILVLLQELISHFKESKINGDFVITDIEMHKRALE